MSTAVVVGGGPAGLMAAEVLADAGVRVEVYERMPSPARKLLLAGHGGLNLTHSEGPGPFLARYGASADRLAPVLDRFTPADLRAWSAGLGQETFVGTSGRVFPRSMRATPLVRAWLTRLAGLGVIVHRRQRWTGWTSDGELRFTGPDGAQVRAAPDVTVLALGGASWPRLGSDGSWVELLTARGVQVTALRAANVGIQVAWTPTFADRFAGVPLKNVSLTLPGAAGAQARGDAMITRSGLEGGPVYALGAAIRAALDVGACTLTVDLRPDLPRDALAARVSGRRPKESASTWLRRTAGLDPVAIGLLRERAWPGGTGPTRPDPTPLPTDPTALAGLIKAAPLTVTATLPLDRAISTAGGVAWSEVDRSMMLRALPGVFVAGEMLDWEAPTGGYLLQASFATGVAAARGALARLGGSAAD